MPTSKSDGMKTEKRVNFRVSLEEWERFEDAAATTGLSVTHFVKMAAFERTNKILSTDSQEFTKIEDES